ncbi:sensor histidine kinase [Dictyobacter arantiisoli]|uniref:histidine kinase n=1 Tax=Dictyobacter arantiisoli TaxID=2014874 RepID=A0A5A5TB26_9CHLR|nr:HAMP domain-containing sensor histidine kinase [Dictyobacter arantiisoli]GCF08557.1 hypothetical protein KDI_21210 [Dictyobacter arantiisoli]
MENKEIPCGFMEDMQARKLLEGQAHLPVNPHASSDESSVPVVPNEESQPVSGEEAEYIGHVLDCPPVGMYTVEPEGQISHLLTERAELQDQVAALREANRRMEDFLGIATHELRTPLTTIKANTQLAMRRVKTLLLAPQSDVPPLETEKKLTSTLNMLERAEHQIEVLNRLVGDMLDVSRIQTGRLHVHVQQEPSDLLAIVDDVLQEQRKATPDRIINVHFPDSGSILVLVDPERIKQVIFNYLLNALKYSEAQQPVAVSVQLEAQAETGRRMVRVQVQDKGMGLEPEEQRRVWECFYQSPKVKVLSGSGVGLGLGLYFSQTLIERHGGQVGVLSAPQEGSTFWFTLPLA